MQLKTEKIDLKNLPLNCFPLGQVPSLHWHSVVLNSKKFGTALIHCVPSAQVQEQSVRGKIAKVEQTKVKNSKIEANFIFIGVLYSANFLDGLISQIFNVLVIETFAQ